MTLLATDVSWLFALLLAASVLASYAALGFAERMSASDNAHRRLWLAVGALAVATGVWAIRFAASRAIFISVLVVLQVIVVLFGAMLVGFLDRKMVRLRRDAEERVASVQDQVAQREMELREVNAKLQDTMIRDGMTGVYNRRHFDETLKEELRRAVRTGKPVSLLMIDIDHLKALNERHGDAAGDECLRYIAQRLRMTLRRPEDIVARYSGEEFAVILPGSNAEGALHIAEMLRADVMALEIANEGSDVAPVVTVSIGVCSKGISIGEMPTGILALADSALYRAKQSGRNCVQIA